RPVERGRDLTVLHLIGGRRGRDERQGRSGRHEGAQCEGTQLHLFSLCRCGQLAGGPTNLSVVPRGHLPDAACAGVYISLVKGRSTISRLVQPDAAVTKSWSFCF